MIEVLSEVDKLNTLAGPNSKREWKDVPGFEGRYVVSNDGHVGSLSREVGGGKRTIRTRLLKQCIRKKDGKVFSVCVNLYDGDGGVLGGNVGRLVLLAFRGDMPGQIAHYRDGDAMNNSLNNMEWTTMTDVALEALNGGFHSERRIQKNLLLRF